MATRKELWTQIATFIVAEISSILKKLERVLAIREKVVLKKTGLSSFKPSLIKVESKAEVKLKILNKLKKERKSAPQ